MRQSRVERVRADIQARKTAQRPPQKLDLDGLARLIVHEKKPLLPTQREFIFSPERRKLYMGPVGCAKTSSLCASVIVPALLYPGSRWGVFRAYWWTLETTTLKRFLECLGRLGPDIIVDKRTGPPMTIWIASARKGLNGEALEPSEIIFHGLDEIEKLGSQEFNGIAVDEVSEISENIVTTLDMRLRHKRPDQEDPDGPFFLNLCCNPVRRSHWIHKKFCGEHDSNPGDPWGKKFKPHPDENVKNLPPGYYEEISSGMSAEMKIRFIDGECGPDPTGKGIFSDEFNIRMHVGDLAFDPYFGMIRGWDFGRRRPAVVWAQKLPSGQVNRLHCLLGENEGLEAFAARVQMISSTRFAACKEWTDYVDPHGTAKRDVSDESPVDVMFRLGFRPQWRDVGINNGLGMMSKGLNTLIRGRPKSMFDRRGCSLLIEGYQGGYTYPKGTEMNPEPQKPFADGIYEHVMDADRYIEVNLAWGSTTPLNEQRKNLRKGRR